MLEQSYIPGVTVSQLINAIYAIADIAGIPRARLDDIVKQINTGLVWCGTGADAPSGNMGLLSTENPCGIYVRQTGSTDTMLYLSANVGANWYTLPSLPIAAGDITLPRGSIVRGSAAGVGEALNIKTLGHIVRGDGNDAADFDLSGTGGAGVVGALDTAAPAGYWTTDNLQAIVDAIKAIIGGTTQAVRAYSGAAAVEPVDNGALVTAIGQEMLLRRKLIGTLLMDQSTPSATVGRGFVFTGGVVSAQGVPDLTVAVASCDCVSGQGKFSNTASVAALAGFTIPAVAGEQRKDIVVIDATSTVVRRAGTEGAAPAADPVLTEGDVPLARVTLTQGADVAISAGNIADLRQTVQTIKASKLLPAATADLLVFLATDQITAPLLKQAILNGAFDDTPETLALFGDGLWSMAKMDSEVVAIARGTIPGGTGAGTVGSLNTSPVTLIAAPADANSFIEIRSAHWWLDFASAAYDSVAGGDLLSLVYHGATDPLTSGISSGFGDAGADAHRIAPAQAKGTPSNVGIDAYCAGGDWYAAAGDSPVKYEIRYCVRPLTW